MQRYTLIIVEAIPLVVMWVSRRENANEMRAYLVLESSVICIMPVVDLALVVYNSEQIIFVYCLRTGVPS